MCYFQWNVRPNLIGKKSTTHNWIEEGNIRLVTSAMELRLPSISNSQVYLAFSRLNGPAVMQQQLVKTAQSQELLNPRTLFTLTAMHRHGKVLL